MIIGVAEDGPEDMSWPITEEAPPSTQETPKALQSLIKEFGSSPNTSLPIISTEATEKSSPPYT